MYDHTLVSSRCAKTRLTLFYCSSRFLQVVQSDLLELLGKAVTCAILSKAGQQRSRVLGLLVKDERLADLDNTDKYASHRIVLTKMHLEQIIKKSELDVFVEALMPHQKAVS